LNEASLKDFGGLEKKTRSGILEHATCPQSITTRKWHCCGGVSHEKRGKPASKPNKTHKKIAENHSASRGHNIKAERLGGTSVLMLLTTPNFPHRIYPSQKRAFTPCTCAHFWHNTTKLICRMHHYQHRRRRRRHHATHFSDCPPLLLLLLHSKVLGSFGSVLYTPAFISPPLKKHTLVGH